MGAPFPTLEKSLERRSPLWSARLPTEERRAPKWGAGRNAPQSAPLSTRLAPLQPGGCACRIPSPRRAPPSSRAPTRRQLHPGESGEGIRHGRHGRREGAPKLRRHRSPVKTSFYGFFPSWGEPLPTSLQSGESPLPSRGEGQNFWLSRPQGGAAYGRRNECVEHAGRGWGCHRSLNY